MSVEIIDRGRGPEIKGTRITVYDIWDYASGGDRHSSIALMLGLSSAQVLAAIEYIEQHKEEVLADYEKILQRAANAELWHLCQREHICPCHRQSKQGRSGFIGIHHRNARHAEQPACLDDCKPKTSSIWSRIR